MGSKAGPLACLLGGLLAVASPAAAEPAPAAPPAGATLQEGETLPRPGHLRAETVVDRLGAELGGHLEVLSGGLVVVDVDAHGRRARFELGGGDARLVRVHVDSEVHVQGSAARVRCRLDVGILGHRLAVEVPELDLASSSVLGQRAVEIRLPLLERQF